MNEQTKSDLKWTAAILVFVILALAALFTNAWNPYTSLGAAGAIEHPDQGTLEGRENLTGVTAQLFKQTGSAAEPPLVLAFELLSVALIAALIGALVLAQKEDA